MDAAMVPCNDNIKTQRHKDNGKTKMDGWREAEREREIVCQAMITVLLNR